MYEPDKETLVTLVTTAITGCNVKLPVTIHKPKFTDNSKQTIINHSTNSHIKPRNNDMNIFIQKNRSIFDYDDADMLSCFAASLFIDSCFPNTDGILASAEAFNETLKFLELNPDDFMSTSPWSNK